MKPLKLFVLVFIAFAASFVEPKNQRKPELIETLQARERIQEPQTVTGNEDCRNQESPETAVWQGADADRKFLWNGRDLSIAYANGTKTDFFKDAAQTLRSKFERQTRTCRSIDYHFRVKSIFGDYVSFEFEESTVCGPGTYIKWGYRTVDLSREQEFTKLGREIEHGDGEAKTGFVSLKEFYSADEIFSALMIAPPIRDGIARMFGEGRIAVKPTSLSELENVLSKNAYEFFDGMFFLPERYLEGFHFHDATSEFVIVKVNLQASSHAGHAMQESLEIKLPAKPNLQKQLLSASSNTEGFLGKDSTSLTGCVWAKF
ncbi:MAG: hypothetical protein KIS76_19675 [Pyrinomonadaceae bacterium]|nr:hypothetical protein [Pyrinomonadaceae bacterium]